MFYRMRCPHCETILDRLGHLEGPEQPGQRVWIGENLYRCRECKQGDNRFALAGDWLVPA